ncbi:hypothetical protein [Nocardioides sp. Soil805]|uniref:hypothetical protein n=1 Tax=Nocardioides sp. Soil805 TaxID=1736416 RepID=UPI0007032C07|nr:hypothetical protein [Nocardioides sp. Soil805]KRF34785.1 hypothetical protein ASG94_11490 [Nocardioides sp. Soil805]
MPMPPPNPTTDGRSDPQTRHEVQQVVRALREEGPAPVTRLEEVLGARFWDDGRFEHAVAVALTEGLVRRGTDGALASS